MGFLNQINDKNTKRLISLVEFFSSPLIYFMLIVSWKCVERPIDSYDKYKTVWLTL